MTGPGRDPARSYADRPERTRRSFVLYRRRPDSERGDMVISAFVLARLLGLRLLTLEARVVVHEDDRRGTGSGSLVLSPLRPDRWRPADRPVPAARADFASAGSDPLARAAQLVEQGAVVLERTRRPQYRG